MTAIEYRNLLHVLIISIIFGSIQGHPHRWANEQRSVKYEFPSPETITADQDQPQHPTTQVRKSLTVDHEPRSQAPVSRMQQTLGSDGKIVFPSDVPHNTHAAVTMPPPAKCRNTTFCEHPSFYPEDFIRQAIKSRQDLRYLATIDTDIGQRIDGSDGDESLCAYEETVIFPKTGRNKDKDWLYIVNEADFPQGVKIEACMTENTACSIIEGFAEGYKTSCKQKYVYRQLAAVSSNGTVGPDLFPFPSSCCCHVKFAGNPLSRLGAGADKENRQSPAFRTGETSRETGKK